MADNVFFDEQKQQSLIKARIIEKYFWAWAKVITSTVKKSPSSKKVVAYIDLFAGPGRYKDGSTSTPLKVLETAIADDSLRDMLVSIFNDADAANVDSLRTAISSIPGVERLKHPPQIINQEVGDNIVKTFQSNKLVPTLFFVDPWGYKGLSLELINSVVKNWGCDCIFFFNYNRINMGLSNKAVENHMNALFGKDRADQVRKKLNTLAPADRELTIVEAICEALEEMGGKYVLPFCFKNESGARTSHHLVFVSKHIKGYEIMKDIMAGESSNNNQGVGTFEYNPANEEQPLLFALSRPLDELEFDLLTAFPAKTMTRDDIYEGHHVGTRYVKKNYNAALQNLESQGKVTVNVPAGKNRRKGTFGSLVTIEFPDITKP